LNRKLSLAAVACTALVLTACGGRGEDDAGAAGSGDCDPGITETTVKLGSSIPLSGPGAAYGEIALTAKKYFEYVNENDGGVQMADGKTRKVDLTVLDDAYDPAKTVSNARELIERTQVFSLFSVLGTSTNEAIYDYVNNEGVPNLFMSTGADVFLDQHDEKPWGMAWLPQYGWEAQVFADYVIENKPGAKVAVLFQNDGYGKAIMAGLEKAFEGTGVEIVASEGYEQAGASVDAQVSKLKGSGADVFIDYATGTFLTQSLKKMGDISWKPLTIVGSGNNHASLVGPAGAATKGAVTFNWLKDVADDSWADDKGTQEWQEFAEAKGVDATDGASANGYTMAQLMAASLENTDGCTRDDLLEGVQSLDDAEADLLLPGVTVSTTDNYPFFVNTVQMLEFDGSTWHPFGDPVTRS
jgi:branched-chain amino acid transport system substrate-binding protein